VPDGVLVRSRSWPSQHCRRTISTGPSGRCCRSRHCSPSASEIRSESSHSRVPPGPPPGPFWRAWRGISSGFRTRERRSGSGDFAAGPAPRVPRGLT
jgi:hypothetical protein